MSQFQTFRNRNQAGTNVQKAETIAFIENHVSSTEVLNVKISKMIKAVLTRTHKEGISETLLFTYVDENPDNNIEVGDYVVRKTYSYLTMLEYDHPLKKDYLKYNLIRCNSRIKVDNVNLPAAYFGSGRAYSNNKSEDIADFTFVQENNQPVVIVQANDELTIGTRFMLAAEAFKIISIDKHSVPGVYALSVEQSDINPSTDDLNTSTAITPEKPIVTVDVNKYQKGERVTLSLVGGYVKFTPAVHVISRNMTYVVFDIPYDMEKLIIERKNENGDIETITKEVE